MAHNLLTAAEDAVARELGWGLYWLYDGRRGWMVRPLPCAEFAAPMDSADKVMRGVSAIANSDDKKFDPYRFVAKKAMKLVANPPPKLK